MYSGVVRTWPRRVSNIVRTWAWLRIGSDSRGRCLRKYWQNIAFPKYWRHFACSRVLNQESARPDPFDTYVHVLDFLRGCHRACTGIIYYRVFVGATIIDNWCVWHPTILCSINELQRWSFKNINSPRNKKKIKGLLILLVYFEVYY